MVMASESVFLKGCRQHNLKNLQLSLPKGRLVVLSGVSGSGKSSLAFDTLYVEGQRRYIEALSPRSRTLLKQFPRPEVDEISGLSPTLALSQSHGRISSRATVATHSDVHDFLALLFARIGKQYSPSSGKRLTRHTRQEIIELLLKQRAEGSRLQILAPIRLDRESLAAALMRLQTQGFVRLRVDGADFQSEDEIPEGRELEVVVDRLVMKEGVRERLADSLATALDLGSGVVRVQEGRDGPVESYSEVYVCSESGESFAPLKPAEFRFTSPQGACPSCAGRGGDCPDCGGARLKATSRSCLVQGVSLPGLLKLSVSELAETIRGWDFAGIEAQVAAEVLPQILARLDLLERVGLDYLELERPGNTLSEGENQRVQLAAQVGAQLSGVLYVLDEPSHGLHAQEVGRLCEVLEALRDLGNSVVVVEHHPQVMKIADHVVELGPGAGAHGGELIFEGSYNELLTNETLTGPWLNKSRQLPQRQVRRPGGEVLALRNVGLHNLQRLSVDIPLRRLVVLCGVSGSGKSTLAVEYVAQQVEGAVLVDQRAPGVTKRSTPATYIGLMTPLRQLFAQTRLAKARGYEASYFSLNKKGGRCEACEGLGTVKIELPMLSDLSVTCEVCGGKRYHFEALQVLYKELSFADALDLSAEEAVDAFRAIPQLRRRLALLCEMGLGYLRLGQAFPTLSGGEMQRLKLVNELARPRKESTMYVLDEPSSGLHFEDVDKLALILDRLVEEDHSLLVVEHNLALIEMADWVIELGPGGGPAGGQVVFEGMPAQLRKADTPTGRALAAS